MKDIIELLAEKILKQQCVLFGGPGLFKEDPGAGYNLYETFAMELADEMRAAGFSFDETQKTNIYYIVPRYRLSMNLGDLQRVNMTDMRSRFVEYSLPKIGRNPLCKYLAGLPFRIIMNTNPDDAIRNNIPSGPRVVFSFYDTSNNSGSHPVSFTSRPHVLSKSDFSANSTVVYNLLGSFENKNSLLLTEDELLEYNIHLNQSDTRLPAELTCQLDENKYYLFLGFQFDQWLLKIIVKALGLPKGKGITYTIPAQSPPIYEQHFYEEQFKFIFVEEANPQHFLNELQKRFDWLATQPGRTTSEPPPRKLKMVLLYNAANRDDAASARTLGFHIKPLRDRGRVWIWSEKFLEADDEIESGIVDNLMDADIILPLISAEMVGERDDQLAWLQRVYGERAAKPPEIRPVLLRDYDYSSIPFLCDFPWLPLNDQQEVLAIQRWTRDAEAYTKIGAMLEELIKTLN